MINYIIKKKQINLISWKQITLIILFKIKFCAQENFLFVSFIIYLII